MYSTTTVGSRSLRLMLEVVGEPKISVHGPENVAFLDKERQPTSHFFTHYLQSCYNHVVE